MLVRCLACWMVLRDVILRTVLCGSGSVLLVCILLIAGYGQGRVPWAWPRPSAGCQCQCGRVSVGSVCAWRCVLGCFLSNLAGPIQRFKSAMLHAWRDKVTADLCSRKGLVPCSSLTLLTSEKEIRRCSEVSWLVGVGMVSCWRGCVDSLFHAVSVADRMGMGIFFGNVPILFSFKSVKILIFTTS